MDPSEVTVLVVEDDEFTRIATIDILRSCRYHVTAVENGREALDLLLSEHGKYDLVLCDMMLPVMNGIELLDELQKHHDTMGHIPVVMTSSNEEMDVVTACLSKGAKDYLIKPIQVNTAKTLVRHVWLSRRLERPSTKSVWLNLEVIRTIGKGTHGTVVLARRKVDGAVVAVKRVRTSLISENGRKQADNEVILLKSLYHVNIVRFYDHFMVDDELNIVMEYADGGNLRQLVKMREREHMGPFPEAVIMCWFAQLVLAVAYIHGKNVLHRDLKAQNVFLTRKNVVKLGDFGISKALETDPTAETPCGTPETMAPEICRGEAYGKKADIWSLGCILYEMIMCRRPFDSTSLPDIFSKIIKGDYPAMPASFSAELRLLVKLMLQQDAAKRPSIEDICRFPFVQAPIQAFLSEHVAEFQEALELEAKLHQPSLNGDHNNSNSSPNSSPSMPRNATASGPPPVPAELNARAPGHGNGVGNGLAPQQRRQPSPPRSASAPIQNTNGVHNRQAFNAMAVGIEPPPSMASGVNSAFSGSPSNALNDTLADELRARVEVSDVRVGLFTTFTACVSAFDLVYTLKKHFKRGDSESRAIVAHLLETKVLNLISAEDMAHPDMGLGSTYFRFQMDEIFVPLNMKHICTDTVPQSAMEVCLQVRQMVAELHKVESFPRGISTGFHSPNALPSDNPEASDFNSPLSRLYRKFLKLVARLQHVDVASLPKHERQPFFINVYNSMVLHGLIEFGVPQNAGQFRSFEKDVNYRIAGLNFTLGDIKHGILRCNRKPPNNYWERQLLAQDPKLQYRLHIRDPRSMLVLIDCAEPIPSPDQVPILKPGRTDTELEEQAEKYCARYVEIDQAAMEIRLPRLFRTFRDDFGASEGDMISWLSQYMDDAPSNLISYHVRYHGGLTS